MPAKASGIDVLAAPTSERKLPLGFEVEIDKQDGNGPQVWVYVQADSGGALVAGNVCSRKASTTTKIVVVCATSSDPANVVGVAQQAFTAGYYGFILKRGRGLVLADTGGITANTGIIPGNAVAGAADSSGGVTAASFGWAPVAISAGVTGYCQIDCRS